MKSIRALYSIGKGPSSSHTMGPYRAAAVLRRENTALMKGSGKVVLLAAKPETIYERVKGSDERPILNGNMTVEYIAGLMEKRRAAYEAAADVTVWTDGKSREEICREILRQLGL